MGMRTSLEGTQASSEGESHAQEANVAEVSYGKPVRGEPEYPDINQFTRQVSDAGRSASKRLSNAPDKQVTNGVGGSVINIAAISVLTKDVEYWFLRHWEPQGLFISAFTQDLCKFER